MEASRILVKGGGFATQLTLHVSNAVDGDPLWSARFNATNPAAVVETHLDFLRSGADIILTNTYQASVEGYMEHLHLDAEQSIGLIKDTVHLAHIAKEKYLAKCTEAERAQKLADGLPMIFASIGPFGAHLHDGSEYTGDYIDYVPVKEIRDWHRVRIDACLQGGVDALAIETIPCQSEAEALIDLLSADYPDVKFWISLQCKNGTELAHGEVFSAAALSIWNALKKNNIQDNCLAIGVNCLNPMFVSPLINSLNGNRSKSERLPVVVYPNSGELYDVEKGWTGREHCVSLEQYVPEWAELGAKIIGGCCRTYARDIRRIKDAVNDLQKVAK